jgi:hypothetical protein
MTQNELSPEHAKPEQQPKGLELKRRVRNWLVDAFISLCCVLVVGIVVDHFHFTNEQFLDHALKFQKRLYESVKALNPLNILVYIGDAYDFLFFHLDGWLTYLLPIALVNFIMKVLFLPLWVVVVGGAWFILPTTVFVEGNTFELILVLIVFVPLALLVAYSSHDDSGGFAFLFGMLLAIAATSLIFWFVQLAMVVALFVVGKLVSLAATLTASSIVASYVYWCLAKGTEHSITESLLHLVRRAVARA